MAVDPTQTQPIIEPKTHPKIGQKFHDGQGNDFQVLGVYMNEGSLWAHYSKLADGSEYNARLEAFEQRFTLKP